MHILPPALPYFVCHCTEYKLLALQVRILEENKLNATTQQFLTAKTSGCASQQESKTHLSLCPSNLQLQNEGALMSCQIQVVEHGRCAARLVGAHPGLQDRFLLNEIADFTHLNNCAKIKSAIVCLHILRMCIGMSFILTL